jgi:hypothetical protein
MRLGSFRTVDAQRRLDAFAGDTELSHRSLIHVKTLLSGAFAKRMGSANVDQGRAVSELEVLYPQRKFTPDGHHLAVDFVTFTSWRSVNKRGSSLVRVRSDTLM